MRGNGWWSGPPPAAADAEEHIGGLRSEFRVRVTKIDERMHLAHLELDEQLAREELCFLLGQVDGVEVVAEAGNGIEALLAG